MEGIEYIGRICLIEWIVNRVIEAVLDSDKEVWLIDVGWIYCHSDVNSQRCELFVCFVFFAKIRLYLDILRYQVYVRSDYDFV